MICIPTSPFYMLIALAFVALGMLGTKLYYALKEKAPKDRRAK